MTRITVNISFEDETELRSWLDARAGFAEVEPTAPVETQVEPTVEGDEPEPQPTRDDTDADGMPYDESVHSDPPSFTADGLWRAKRGKAEEARAARAAFKAAGGDEPAPEDIETRDAEPAPAMPGTDAPVEPAPAMPGTDAPAPVTFAAVMAKATEVLEAGKIDGAGLRGLYAKTTGVDPNSANVAKETSAVFQVNETARAALMAELSAL